MCEIHRLVAKKEDSHERAAPIDHRDRGDRPVLGPEPHARLGRTVRAGPLPRRQLPRDQRHPIPTRVLIMKRHLGLTLAVAGLTLIGLLPGTRQAQAAFPGTNGLIAFWAFPTPDASHSQIFTIEP